KHDMHVAVHAIGDACLDKVLNAIEKALNEYPRTDHRHGIVHCQISRQDQLERMIRLNTHIYAQSIFLDYDNHIVEDRVGKDLASTSYSWKTLKDNGLWVSNGSDAPVELPDALRGMECAVTRTSIDGTGPYLENQAFSVKEAIDSFTSASAHASFEEDVKGKIAAGYLADFVVLKEDPFSVEPRHIHDISIAATYLGGRCVYKK
ncbi:MAG: amidohydrolase family protein, partial [Erysipelotrichaceae bacterium]|nr:amidohydrolase family protein [Erysipelotrichaceae bacterium]